VGRIGLTGPASDCLKIDLLVVEDVFTLFLDDTLHLFFPALCTADGGDGLVQTTILFEYLLMMRLALQEISGLNKLAHEAIDADLLLLLGGEVEECPIFIQELEVLPILALFPVVFLFIGSLELLGLMPPIYEAN
jgi:hypothetical protein